MKKCVIGARETHPDILRGGHRNPYQLENAIKSGGKVFCLQGISWQRTIHKLHTKISWSMLNFYRKYK